LRDESQIFSKVLQIKYIINNYHYITKKKCVGYFCDSSLGWISSLQNRKLCIIIDNVLSNAFTVFASFQVERGFNGRHLTCPVLRSCQYLSHLDAGRRGHSPGAGNLRTAETWFYVSIAVAGRGSFAHWSGKKSRVPTQPLLGASTTLVRPLHGAILYHCPFVKQIRMEIASLSIFGFKIK